MNRKFRAYIPHVNMMFYNIDVYASGDMGISTDHLTDDFYKLYHIDSDYSSIKENGTYAHVITINTGDEYIWLNEGQFHPMQATGLTDRSGKDCYHGDIVRVEGFTACKVVEWNEKFAYYYLKCVDTDQIVTLGVQPFEIVGNIYENPELVN